MERKQQPRCEHAHSDTTGRRSYERESVTNDSMQIVTSPSQDKQTVQDCLDDNFSPESVLMRLES